MSIVLHHSIQPPNTIRARTSDGVDVLCVGTENEKFRVIAVAVGQSDGQPIWQHLPESQQYEVIGI